LVLKVTLAVAIGAGAITIENALTAYPATFCARIVKLNVPAVVGVPVIAPVVALRASPGGKAPLPAARLQVIGVVPVADRLRVMGVPTVAGAKDTVVMLGGILAGAMVIENCLST